MQVATPLVALTGAAVHPGIGVPPPANETVPLLGAGYTVAVKVTAWPGIDGEWPLGARMIWGGCTWVAVTEVAV